MPQCDDLLEHTAERQHELEASPLMSGLRDLMERADGLRAQEERADAARHAFRDAMTRLTEAVFTQEEVARVEAALPALEAAARASVEERQRLHQHSESLRLLLTGLNAQLGSLLGRDQGRG